MARKDGSVGRELSFAVALYAALLLGITPAGGWSVNLQRICSISAPGGGFAPKSGYDQPDNLAGGHCAGLSAAIVFPPSDLARCEIAVACGAEDTATFALRAHAGAVKAAARGPPISGGVRRTPVLFLIQNDPPARPVHIFILRAPERPEKRPEREAAQRQRRRDQNDKGVHRLPPLISRSAFSVTTSDEPLIAMAEISGVTRPAAAKGIAKTL